VGLCSPDPLTGLRLWTPLGDFRHPDPSVLLCPTPNNPVRSTPLITDKLAMSEHVLNVVLECAESMHVIKVLRHHGMSDKAMQAVYTTVVLAKPPYTCSAWWGYATNDDRNRIEAVIHRGVRASLYPADSPAAAAQLVENYDDTLFAHIINSQHHVLHKFLSPK